MKILAAIVFVVDFILLLLAMGAPFANPWFFILSFVVVVYHIAYGWEIMEWVDKHLRP